MSRTDAELVVAFRRGDRRAFAELYDRYADRIHTFAYARLRDRRHASAALEDTFLRASAQLGQLREPDRFRPWLFAIARSAAADRGRDRSKDAVSDGLVDVAGDDPDIAAAVEAGDTARLVWAAAADIRDRDQELLEINLREGLDGSDLAMAMGVKPAHVNVMVGRMKRRLETAVGSFLVARQGRGDCIELDRILAEWDGRYSPSMRSNVSSHIEACGVCTESRRAAIHWEKVAPAMPSTSASPDSRTVVLATVGLEPVTAGSVGSGSGGPGRAGRQAPDRAPELEPRPVEAEPPPRRGGVRELTRRIDAGVIVAATAVVGAGIALLFSIDRGTEGSSQTDVTVTDQSSSTTVAPIAGAPDESVPPTSLPPTSTPPTAVDSTPPTVPPATTADPTPKVLVDVPSFRLRPEVSSIEIAAATIYAGTSACLGSTLATSTSIFVTATDESGIASVEATWADGTVTLLSSDPTTFAGFIGPWTVPIDDVVVVTATDTEGNAQTASLAVVVDSCPL